MLQKLSAFPGVPGPVVVIVMDGYGIPKTDVGSAIAAARKPTLDALFAGCPHITLRAHGTAVGMPSDDDMGNSEVGHNAIGAGQVYAQGAALVANAIADGAIWAGEAWKEIVAGAKTGRGVIHFIGLFSDGNVHSHIDHLKAMVAQAKLEGVRTVRIHALLDGRDVPETSALDYVVPFEAFLAELSTDGFDARIASGGGRQYITMDRYDANWPMVEKGWKTHVLGEGPQFANATEAVNGLREKNPGTIDQDLPEFVIAEGGKPIGTIEDGDSVVFYNFRGDRAIEITRAFEDAALDKFDRVRLPRVTYAGMLLFLLIRRGSYRPQRGWSVFGAQVLGATLLMSAFLLWAARRFDWLGTAAWPRAGLLALVLMAAAALYFGALMASGVRLRQLLRR